MFGVRGKGGERQREARDRQRAGCARTEVSQLDAALLIDEHILRLQVSVQHQLRVAEVHTCDPAERGTQ